MHKTRSSLSDESAILRDMDNDILNCSDKPVYEESSKKRHIPNKTLMRKPMTKPICMRREKITFDVGSSSFPSSQNAVDFRFRMKKIGRNGKKNPTITP